MPERPLLLFPTPETASRSTLTSPRGGIAIPTAQRQWDRLSPAFSQLQASFEARRIEIRQNIQGTDPREVLVIETIGSLEDFVNAVQRIQGLEWMDEIEVDEILPDEDFFDQNNSEKKLSGRLYLLMTNQRALEEMLSLWRRYQASPNMQFERGLTKFRDVFLQLKSIRLWDVQDRLLETGVTDIWQEELEIDGNRVIQFETELWYRGSEALRASSAANFENLVQQVGGRIVNQSVIEGIAYHGLLTELPAHAIQTIIDDPITELVKCENVMFFRPVGQMVVGKETPEGDVEIAQIREMQLPTGDPVIALFDGFPLTNHQLLKDRLIIDDPDNWEAEYSASERKHGTSMASLIVHGDLNQTQSPLARRVYLRPIMKPDPRDNINSPRSECVPRDILFVDLLHNSIRRLFETVGSENPAAPSVKIINLSIGDTSRQFVHTLSPPARLLDWLSVKYKVLFIVSAGNHLKNISLGVSRAEFNSFDDKSLEEATINALYRDAQNRRILSPAETINGITVGAAHHDISTPYLSGRGTDLLSSLVPSPVSAFGSGYRRSIKPDILYLGGRQYYREILGSDPIEFIPTSYVSPPGIKVASPGSNPGDLSATIHSCGTSNATALISRAAGICYDSLREIFNEQASMIDASNYEVPLLKAMLIHGCSWGDMGSRISQILQTPDNGRKLKGLISRWIGYGLPDVDRVLACTEQRATVLGFGQLSDGAAHVFSLPLPPSLASRRDWRRLTVTLAWLSPILPNTQKYRTASLWFEALNNGLTSSRQDVDRHTVKRGTIQHEIFEGQNAEPFTDGDFIRIKVNCRNDAGKILSPIAYGLVVSLEVAQGVDIAVYNEIQTRIQPQIQIQP